MGGRPVKKVSKNRKTLTLFYIMFVIVLACKIFAIYSRQKSTMTYWAIAVDLMTILVHTILTCKNPGYLRNEGLEFMKLLETFDAQSLCPECEIIRTGRSRHCIICHQCVDRYDHHCPWINNCIGLNNHNQFLLYLIFQEACLVLSIVQAGMVIDDFIQG